MPAIFSSHSLRVPPASSSGSPLLTSLSEQSTFLFSHLYKVLLKQRFLHVGVKIWPSSLLKSNVSPVPMVLMISRLSREKSPGVWLLLFMLTLGATVLLLFMLMSGATVSHVDCPQARPGLALSRPRPGWPRPDRPQYQISD